MIRYKFSKELDQEFSSTLRKRVNQYFKANEISRNGNANMVGKTVAALSLYLLPFGLLLSGLVTSIPLMFLMWMLMGLGMAFIGTSVMHDALHGSYSNSKSVNTFLGWSAMLLGADGEMWKIQHNVLHHTYTNIEDADEDIQPRYVLRFSPHQPLRWFHRYQHVYALFFYSISTLVWITAKDFKKLADYSDKGLIKPKAKKRLLRGIILRKVMYYAIFLALPLWLVPAPAWLIGLMFISMHFTASLLLSLIFQPAHVMPSSEFIMQDEEEIEQNWNVHQLTTTTNFGMNNRMLGWFIGGLNFQIEHHLFPNVCHVHYANLSKIVQETTAEFNLPYYAKSSFSGAIADHFKMLKALGRDEIKVNTKKTEKATLVAA